MIIVIEGPDGAGKTTLARALCARFNLEYHHEGPPPAGRPALEHYGALVENARWRTQFPVEQTIDPAAKSPSQVKSGVVFDRLALGQTVYGPIYRNDISFGADEMRVMNRLLTAADAFEILCLSSYETCLTNWRANRRYEMITDEAMFQAVYEGFAQFALAYDHVVDYTEPGVYEILMQVIEGHDWHTLPLGVIGSPHAQYLFVGDRGSDPTSLVTDLAFFGVTDSSKYLTGALNTAGFLAHECAFVNARRHDGRIITWPETRVTIALGEHATIECDRRHRPCHSLPHPQYWQRFHHHDMSGYVRLLRACR